MSAVFSPHFRTKTGEKDLDRNGYPDRLEGDLDMDGIKDILEGDLDGNGIVDPYELDLNGNGIPDYLELGQTGCCDPRISLDDVILNAQQLCRKHTNKSPEREEFER